MKKQKVAEEEEEEEDTIGFAVEMPASVNIGTPELIGVLLLVALSFAFGFRTAANFVVRERALEAKKEDADLVKLIRSVREDIKGRNKE